MTNMCVVFFGQLDFYTRFKATHSEMKVSFASFRNLRAFFVRLLRDFNTCCCRYHMQMAEITIGFNNMRGGKFHFEDDSISCACGCDSVCSNILAGTETEGPVACQAKHHRYRRSTHLWEQSLCPWLPGSDWHALTCVMGECPHCGFDLIPLCEREVDPQNSKEMEWKRFENVTAGKTRQGDPKKVVRLEYKLTTTRAFLQYAAGIFPEFVRHQHTARWQDSQFKESLRKLQPGEVFSLIDFAENYSFKGQD